MCFFTYFFSALALAALLGLYIPSTVVVSSVIEFMNTADGSLNSVLLTYPASIYAGLLVIWLTVFNFFPAETPNEESLQWCCLRSCSSRC